MSPIASSGGISQSGGGDEPLSAHPDFTRELRVARNEVCDWAIHFERLRRKVPMGWITTIAWVLIGAGFGAVVQNGKWNVGAILSVAIGAALLFGAMFSREDRTENLHNLCDDFLRFVDKWEAMEGYRSNSEYVLEVVERDRLVGIHKLAASVRSIRRNGK